MAFFSLTVLLAAFGLLVSAITWMVLNFNPDWSLTKIIISWYHMLSQSCSSTASEIPLHSPPMKKDSSMGKQDALKKILPSTYTPSTDYKDVFPPTTRNALLLAASSLSSARKSQLRLRDVGQMDYMKDLISFTADYRRCSPSTCTPMGISLGEVDALGDFPDYASLSGVPLPEPYKDFDITKAIPRPYRPFRWGYHQTMSLGKLETDWWLELESTYIDRIAERRALFAKYSTLVLNHLPGSELACKEIMEHALQFLCARYPQHFSLSYSPNTGEHTFHNGLLKTSTPTNSLHPLHMLLENVPEDFAIMIRNPADGQYYFRAGLLCSSLGWNVDTKLGLKLSDIHAPIPDYKEKMQFSMDRYFARMPTDKPIQRGSWGLEVDKPLFMPPGDPHELYREKQDPDLVVERLHLRVDWQTLRRLPLSGAIVFNFKALFTPVEEFRTEPYIPTLVLKVLRDGKKTMMEYKNTWHIEHIVLPALETWAREQEEEGVTERGWEVRTLEESPWFPGWEGKWHERQGF